MIYAFDTALLTSEESNASPFVAIIATRWKSSSWIMA